MSGPTTTPAVAAAKPTPARISASRRRILAEHGGDFGRACALLHPTRLRSLEREPLCARIENREPDGNSLPGEGEDADRVSPVAGKAERVARGVGNAEVHQEEFDLL